MIVNHLLGVYGRIHLRARSEASIDDRIRDRENNFTRANANNSHPKYWACVAAALIVEEKYHQVMLCRQRQNVFENADEVRSQMEIGMILDALIDLVKCNQYRNGQGFDRRWNSSARDVHGLDGASRPEARLIYNAHLDLFQQVCRDVKMARDSRNDTFKVLVDTGRYECLDYIESGLLNLDLKESQAEVFLREVFLTKSGLFGKVSFVRKILLQKNFRKRAILCYCLGLCWRV